MKLLKTTLLIAGCLSFATSDADAHGVALGWNVLPSSDVTFYLAHWHGPLGGPSQFLTIDGINYNFTGVLNSTPSISGLEGGMFNPTYGNFSGDTLTMNPGYDNYLTVTVSGLTAGNHAFTASTDALTSWNIPSTNGSFAFTLPPPPPASGVPDGGSTLALLGLAMTAAAGMRRKFGI